MARFTLDSTTEFLFGSCVNSVREPFPLPGEVNSTLEYPATSSLPTAAFVRAFVKAQDVIARRLYIGQIWKLLEIRKDQTIEYRDHIDRYIEPLVEAALAKEKTKKQSSSGSPTGDIGDDTTFLEHMVSQTQGVVIAIPSPCQKTLRFILYFPDPIVIRDQILNLLIAGRDTVSAVSIVPNILCLKPGNT